jgi:hypothetical protein
METILLVDTEFITLNKPFVYDLSYLIARKVDDKYITLKSVGNVVKQVYQNKMMFETAYYSEKRKLYVSALKGKTYKQNYLGIILRQLKKDIAEYNVSIVLGYNVNADLRSIGYTSEYLKLNNPLNETKVIDLMPIVVNTICDTNEYKNFAKENKLITEKGYYKMSVESVMKYITNDIYFVEKHLGKSDNENEIDLLNYTISKGASLIEMPKRFLKVE